MSVRRAMKRKASGPEDTTKYDRKALDKFIQSVAARCKYDAKPSTMGWIARREVIDQHTKELEDVLAEVTTALNSSLETLAISRRPNMVNLLEDKVLSRVFEHSGECGADLGTTRAITLTCSHWRKLAFSTPTLWTSMNCTHMSLSILRCYAKHSASQPLHVQLALGNADCRTACEDILPRIKTLVLHGGDPSSIKDTSWLFTQPANALEHMSLRCSGFRDHPQAWLHMLNWPKGYGLTDPIFAGGHPKLCKLELSGCRLPWQPGMYKNLTGLTISLGLEQNPDVRSDILDIFHESPKLEEFALHSPGEIPITRLGSAEPLIPLRHLRHLHLSLHSQEMSAILSSIATPSTLRLTLGCVINKGVPTLRRCVKLPKDVRCLPCLERIQRLELDAPGNKIVAFAALNEEDHDVPVLSVCIITDQDLVAEKAITASFAAMRGLPLYSLQDLSIRESNAVTFKGEDVAMFFWDTAKDIRSLTLSVHGSSAFRMIAEQYKHQVRPYCPNLSLICIDRMSISKAELLDICEILACEDRMLNLNKVHFDHPAATVLENVQKFKFAKVSVTNTAWRNLRSSLPFNQNCT